MTAAPCISTIDDIVTRLGGPAAVARRCNVRPHAVTYWKNRNALPGKHVSAVAAMAKDHGLRLINRGDGWSLEEVLADAAPAIKYFEHDGERH